MAAILKLWRQSMRIYFKLLGNNPANSEFPIWFEMKEPWAFFENGHPRKIKKNKQKQKKKKKKKKKKKNKN